MQNRWRDEDAASFLTSELALRVYTSRLLGQDDDLVLHGGGNTSVKSSTRDIFGRDRETLFVKGSGWDLKTIEAEGFAPCDLGYLHGLAALEQMSDSDMMQQLRMSLLDPSAPTPSVEAILHAIIPFRFVDHTHTDAVVSVSNTADGENRLREIFGDEVLILPYIMPGFILARQVFEQTRNLDWSPIRGIFLMHHGLFTFHDEARGSYDTMIELVTRVETFLNDQGILTAQAEAHYQPQSSDLLQLAALRRAVSEVSGNAMLATLDCSRHATGFSSLTAMPEFASRGPVTPDHSIHTKCKPLIFDDEPLQALEDYAKAYVAYFDAHDDGSLTCLDPAPRYALWKNKGLICFAPNVKRLQVVHDISCHTMKAVQWGEALGGWQALPEKELFDVEYWELEQAKLSKAGNSPPLAGKVVLISGAASGIGGACVEEFSAAGASVIALDINPVIHDLQSPQVKGITCDVTDSNAVAAAIEQGIMAFGGIDILISNAGCFSPSQLLSEISDDSWQASLDLNLTAHMKLMRACLPYLQRGLQPAVVIIGSKNVPAPGPGAGAYSAAKAGLTQMARVAALELGGDGIRVNVLHPNAVFDTGVWDDETLQDRASHYGLSIEQYKQNNVLSREVSSRDVAVMARLFAGPETACTTGAQVPIDGGNERVI